MESHRSNGSKDSCKPKLMVGESIYLISWFTEKQQNVYAMAGSIDIFFGETDEQMCHDFGTIKGDLGL